jgi:hypothetical protein
MLEDIDSISLESPDLPGTDLDHRRFVRGHNLASPAGRLPLTQRCLSGSRERRQRVGGSDHGARKSRTGCRDSA